MATLLLAGAAWGSPPGWAFDSSPAVDRTDTTLAAPGHADTTLVAPGAAGDSAAVLADSTSVAPSSATPPPQTRPHARPDLALRGHGRPNPIRAAWRAAANGASDMIYLYTTPLRMDRGNVAELAGVAAVGGALYACDGGIERDFQHSRRNPLYREAIIEAGGHLASLGLIARTHAWWEGGAIAGWLFDVPLLRTIPVEVLESNFIVGSLRQPLEQIVARRRPSDGQGPRVFRGGDSFPSGHASVVCETASILSHHFTQPWARAAFWSVAGLVCLQRVDEPGHNHWPSDVWAGAALGAWAGHTIAMRNEERRQGIEQRRWYDVLQKTRASWSLVPVARREGSGLALVSRF